MDNGIKYHKEILSLNFGKGMENGAKYYQHNVRTYLKVEEQGQVEANAFVYTSRGREDPA